MINIDDNEHHFGKSKYFDQMSNKEHTKLSFNFSTKRAKYSSRNGQQK